MSRWAGASIPLLLLPILLVVAGEAPAEPPAGVGADTRYEQHVAGLKKRLPDGGKGFTIVVQRPFVVIGDGAPAAVRRRAVNTVK